MHDQKHKLLIGTPAHESKDYCIKEFLESVKENQDNYHFSLIDNSPNISYQDKLKNLCSYYRISNYQITHLDFDSPDNIDFQNDKYNAEKRVAFCREKLKDELLSGDYTHMFFWESDIILSPGSIDKLMQFNQQFDVIMHDYPSREDPTEEAWGFGCTIIKRKWFEDFSFIWDSDTYHGGEHRFLKKIRLGGGKWVELHNFLDIKHLTK